MTKRQKKKLTPEELRERVREATRGRKYSVKVGQRGQVVIPQSIREEIGLEVGCHVLIEVRSGKLIIEAAEVVPISTVDLTPEKTAKVLLEAASNDEEYALAREEVCEMGLNPDAIAHDNPDVNTEEKAPRRKSSRKFGVKKGKSKRTRKGDAPVS